MAGGGLAGLDYAVSGALVALMVFVGWRMSRSASDGTGGFFLGGRRVPAWAACLSFVAAEISAMTIVGVPADSYRSNWNYAQFFIGSALARVVVAFVFIPAFFSANCTTIYEFLRDRFGAPTQYGATGLFFATRLLASGVRLYLASLAVATIMGWGLAPTVLAFTIVPILFMGFGGMRAAIWTGVVQAVVFLAGGLAVLAFLHLSLDGGIAAAFASAFPVGPEAAARASASAIPAAQAVFAAAAESGSRAPYFFNLAWNPGPYEPGGAMAFLHGVFGSSAALWTGVIAGFFTSLASFGTDQENAQRLLCVETRRQSQRMILWTIVAGGAVLLVYLAVGSGLAAYYLANAAATLPEKTDNVFPHFIATVLPAGLKGLLLGAIVLASIDSPLVSLSTSAVTDLYRPLVRRGADEAHYVRVSRFAVAGFGAVLGALAMFFSGFDGALWVGFKIGGVTFGSLLGVFLVGILWKGRAGDAALWAMGANTAAMAALLWLIETKVLWLSWAWLPVLGTVCTAGLTLALAGLRAPAPRAAAPAPEAAGSQPA
ncbi:MAG: hypothetical protein SF028_03155 [Candidatus Sumerlaeia bacterium]|nr:hypothetical protein [Candidatus Sumerlaeia bacterium]